MAELITLQFPNNEERASILSVVEEALANSGTRSELRANLVAGFISIADEFPDVDEEEIDSDAEDC
jgi:hypothetical protein